MAASASVSASASVFDVREHVIPCQHIRGYPRASKDPTAVLRLAVKQYVPTRIVPHAKPAVTIVALHANGVPKETYEPVWEELATRLDGNIKSIWIADAAHQGASGVLNEELLGDDPNWFDHSRDLLGMVNHFRDQIQAPIIGVAHSMGCAQLVHLAHMHPALFQSLVLIEPVMQETIPAGPNASFMTSYRPDLWPSRAAARAAFAKNKFYASWDARALDRYLQHGLRETPTPIFPDAPPGSVTLRTTKHQEAWSYLRSTFAPRPADGHGHGDGDGGGDTDVDRREKWLTADYDATQAQYVFHRAEPGLAFRALPTLQPAVFWVFAKQSYINPAKERDAKISRTGIEARGSGGVSAAVVSGANHLLPLEKVGETAALIAAHVEQQVARYVQEQAFWKSFDAGKSQRGQQLLSEQWMKAVRQKSDTKRPVIGKTKL